MSGGRDIIYKRCGCADEATCQRLGRRFPRLTEADHGSWYYAVQVSSFGGRKARCRRGLRDPGGGGGGGRRAGAFLDGPSEQATAGAWTVARWLKLAEPNMRRSTICGYRDHINRYLIPRLGSITLGRSRRQAPAGVLRPARRQGRSDHPMAPDRLTRSFRRHAAGARLPPVRLRGDARAGCGRGLARRAETAGPFQHCANGRYLHLGPARGRFDCPGEGCLAGHRAGCLVPGTRQRRRRQSTHKRGKRRRGSAARSRAHAGPR
jgi:hypothetical protein